MSYKVPSKEKQKLESETAGKRRRFSLPRFRLSTLLFLNVIVAIPLGYWVSNGRQQQLAVVSIRQLRDSHVTYDFQTPVGKGNAKSLLAGCLRRVLGTDFVDPVWAAGLNSVLVNDLVTGPLEVLTDIRSLQCDHSQVGDKTLERVAGMHNLIHISLVNTLVTDQGIKNLYDLNTLRRVDVRGTPVTEEGARLLQQKLPDCVVDYGPSPSGG